MITSHPSVVFYRRIQRAMLIAVIGSVLSGCVSDNVSERIDVAAPHAAFVAMYAGHPEETYPIPAIDVSRIDPRFLRREVEYRTDEQPGTIIIDAHDRHLYLIRENNRALRYGIGVGAAGMSWSGRAQVGRKAVWPRWTPTAAMIRRDPERNRPWANGMAPGLENPLGPRALYLYQNGQDTLYRIHGTNEPHTIGQAVSSGCIRMLNQDIIDLYARVPVGARVVVRNSPTQVEAVPVASVAEEPEPASEPSDHEQVSALASSADGS